MQSKRFPKSQISNFVSIGHKPSVIDFAQQHNRVHQALKYILDLIPTGPTSLFPLLVAEFPHKRESIRAHITFVKNILAILDYAPILREQVLAIIIDRIIKIDVCTLLDFLRFASCRVHVVLMLLSYSFQI